MMQFRRRCLFLILLLVWQGWGISPVARSEQTEQTATLEVIGRGTIYRDNVAKARDEAIADGLWNAVEQGVGLLISSSSVVDHLQLLSDRVYSQSEEFIHDYKVLTESKSGRHYRLVVRATLSMRALRDKLQDIGILMTHEKRPSVLLLLSEQNIGQVAPRHSWTRRSVSDVPLVIEDTLASDLRKKGFVIVKPETLEDLVIDLWPGYGELELSDEAAAKLAKQVDAEVVILGKGFAHLSGNVLGRDTKSVEAQMSVRAIRAENGMVVAASEGSGAAAHANEMVAGTEALSLAASSVAEELSRKLAVNWGGQTSEWVLVELVVKGVKEYRDFVEFRTTISKEVPGIKNVYLKAIKAGEAKMDVEVKGDSRILADELLLKRFDDFGIDIIEVGQKAIILELIPKQDLLGEPQASSQETDLENRNRLTNNLPE
jgi:hypothetical protein